MIDRNFRREDGSIFRRGPGEAVRGRRSTVTSRSSQGDASFKLVSRDGGPLVPSGRSTMQVVEAHSRTFESPGAGRKQRLAATWGRIGDRRVGSHRDVIRGGDNFGDRRIRDDIGPGSLDGRRFRFGE